jgi:DNA mismatch repair protein MutS2
VRSAARAAVDAIAERTLGPLQSTAAAEPLVVAREPRIGDRVLVGGLGLEGTVTALRDGSAEVDVRGKRMRASARDLRVVGGGGERPIARVNVNVELQPHDDSNAELNVVGCTVDEAIAKAERFLDEALLVDRRVLRIIHGHGTGQLRRALAGWLRQHPLVVKFEAAAADQGGGGVTVVELKD